MITVARNTSALQSNEQLNRDPALALRGDGEWLGDVASGDLKAIFAAMAAAVLFGVVHALMPGHGKTVLVSYHLGQPGRLRDGIANGAILSLTHVGLAVVLASLASPSSAAPSLKEGAHPSSRSQAV